MAIGDVTFMVYFLYFLMYGLPIILGIWASVEIMRSDMDDVHKYLWILSLFLGVGTFAWFVWGRWKFKKSKEKKSTNKTKLEEITNYCKKRYKTKEEVDKCVKERTTV